MISNLFLVIDPLTVIAAGSAIAGLIGSVASSHMNRKAQRETNAMQLRAQQATNAFNAAEAQKERDWNDYSSQSDRMRAAGLNPSLMFGGQGSPVTSGAAASGAAVPGLTAPTFDFGQNQLGSFADIASAMQSVANAKKAGAETNAIESMLGEQIRDLQLRNEYQSILNTYQGKKSATELAKMVQDIERQYVEIDNLIKEGNLTEAKTRLTNVQEEIGQEEKGLTKADKELRQALSARRFEYTQNILDTQEADIANKKSQTAYTNTLNRLEPGRVAAIIQNLDSQTLSNLATAAYTNALKNGQDITNMSLPDVIAGNLDEQEMRTITGYDIADYETHKSSSSSGAKIGPVSWNSSEQGSTPNRNSRVRVGDTYGVTKQRIKQRGYKRHRSYR